MNAMKKNTEALLVASSEVGLEVNNGKLCIWLCLATKLQDKIIIYWLLINPLKMWHISSIFE